MITDEQKQLIREMTEQGQTVNEIAEQLGIGEKTVRRHKNKSPAIPEQSEANTEDNSNNDDYIIQSSDLSSDDDKKSNNKQDELKGRHFTAVVYPSEKWVKEHVPDCEYDGSSGWGDAPDDWIEQLQNTGLSFVVSPLHYKDENPDGTMKKPHWHIIISWSNTTTYRSARALTENILHCPLPQLLKAVNGMYRYLTHADNPEKHQYNKPDEKPRCYNGWQRPLDDNDVIELKRKIRLLIYTEDCEEYGELLSVCATLENEYFDVASRNTFFFDKLCSSYRHNPIKCLKRVFDELAITGDDEKQQQVLETMQKVTQEISNGERCCNRKYKLGGFEDESNNQ